MMTLMTVLIISSSVMAQAPGELTGVDKAKNGDVIVTGVDPFGASVTVVYNAALTKVYQERSFNGETSYARFNDGTVTDYGVYSKPVAAQGTPINRMEALDVAP